MGIRIILMINKQGQTRLAQYYENLSIPERRALEGEITRKCLAHTEQQIKVNTEVNMNMGLLSSARSLSIVITRSFTDAMLRYSSWLESDNNENELTILVFIHLLVGTMVRHFGNVCELDIMVHLEKTHFIVEEMVMNGCIVQADKNIIVSPLHLMDRILS